VGEKLCPDPTTGVQTCVNVSNSTYGCGATSCNSCAAQVTGHTPALSYTCINNKCIPGPCPLPYLICDPTHTYCDTNPNSDPRNCANCGNDCTKTPLGPNATAWGCASLVCKIASCAPGFADCNGVPTDGCEVQLGPSNCWSCPLPVTGDAGAAQCPCKQCYAGPNGLPSVCPACNTSAHTCDTTNMLCVSP
jgi:hypothetical protein